MFDIYHPDLTDEDVAVLRDLWQSPQLQQAMQAWWNLIDETRNIPPQHLWETAEK